MEKVNERLQWNFIRKMYKNTCNSWQNGLRMDNRKHIEYASYTLIIRCNSRDREREGDDIREN